MKIAVVSTDGKRVDEHFGQASRFLIYQLAETGPSFVEEREAEPLSVGNPDHPFDRELFDQILQTIGDCERVYITQIGQRPASELMAEGITPIIHTGPIAQITV